MKTQRAPRILFVSPDASRSGAPMVLLHLLRWLRANTDWRLELLLLRGGPLEDDFARAAHVVHRSRALSAAQNLFTLRAALDSENIGGLASRFQKLQGAKPLLRIAEKIALRAAARSEIARTNYDLIYVNTAAAGGALRVLAKRRAPIIAHLHELEYALTRLGKSARETLRCADNFIACSQAVAKNLTDNHAIKSARIEVVYEFVETRRDVDVVALKTQMRALLNLPEDAFVVVGGGTLEWRKGADWWLQIARLLREKCAVPHAAASTREGENAPSENAPRDFHFVWVGSAADALFDLELRHDARRMNLENVVTFTGAMPDARDVFVAGNAFLLPSREDPFPLVAIEAAALGLPILCFQNSGGMPELVESDAGFIAPYGDCEAMAQQLFILMNDETLREKLGARAAEKARERCDVSVGAAQIKNLIERVLAAR